ncbi:MAG: hypothetical protein H7144_05275 [Burkholderiales bacterium]|nr:hypothetical protein [Phycisphaerae bacterium]
MNQLLVAWFCVGASIALLVFSVWLSSDGAPGGIWLTLLMGLVLFLAGILALRERPDV